MIYVWERLAVGVMAFTIFTINPVEAKWVFLKNGTVGTKRDDAVTWNGHFSKLHMQSTLRERNLCKTKSSCMINVEMSLSDTMQQRRRCLMIYGNTEHRYLQCQGIYRVLPRICLISLGGGGGMQKCRHCGGERAVSSIKCNLMACY